MRVLDDGREGEPRAGETLLSRRAAMARLGGLAIVTAAACRGVQRQDVAGEPIADGARPMQGDRVRRLLGFSALASSAHNSQPWRVRQVSTHELLLLRDRTRRLPAVDPNDRELVLSLGSFLENLAQASGALGYACDLVPIDGAGDEMATIRLADASPDPDAKGALARITRRRILRSGYRDRAIAPAHVRAMLAAAGNATFCARGSRECSLLRDGTIEANRLQAARDDAQRELASWIRWRADDVRTRRDGLTAESMEIGGVAGWWVRHRYTAASVMTPAFRTRGVQNATRQASAGGGWIVVASGDSSRAALLDAGRRYERLLLSLRDLGLAAHPMTQMLEEPATRAGLESSLGVSATIQFLLRVGYVDNYPEPVSVRRPVEWFLI